MAPVNGIEVVNISKTYGTFVAVEALSFNVPRGEILGLVGPNGAGKTTTLRAIAGIHPPSEGHISICGIDLRIDPVGAKKRLAFMPDEPRLFDYLTAEEHMQFMARLYDTTDYKPALEALLEEFELADKRKSMPTELSRGMKQKLMIACGFIHNPEVIILDEPLTGLDPLGIRRMKESIMRRARDGASVVLSSHLLHLVEELCDSVLIIHRGKRVAYGTIEQLKHQIARSGEISLEDAFMQIIGTDA